MDQKAGRGGGSLVVIYLNVFCDAHLRRILQAILLSPCDFGLFSIFLIILVGW